MITPHSIELIFMAAGTSLFLSGVSWSSVPGTLYDGVVPSELRPAYVMMVPA